MGNKYIEVRLKPEALDILSAVRENGWYCPCAVIKNESTQCMCEEFRQQIESEIIGECKCGLYEIIKGEERCK